MSSYRFTFSPSVVLLILLALLMIGCGKKAQESPVAEAPVRLPQGKLTAQPPAPTPVPEKPTGPVLGKKQEGKSFAVIFSTVPESPKVGVNTFTAQVLDHDKPVEGAVVKVTTEMPAMKMSGPTAELKPGKPGTYVGKIDLSMGGVYRLKVDVTAGSSHEEIPYDIEVLQ